MSDDMNQLRAENEMLRVELQEAREANDVLRPYLIEDVDDLDALPIGSIVRAQHWGDVAVKVRQRIWSGKDLPTADDLLENDDANFSTHEFWEVAGGGGVTDCDGPFLLLYRGSEHGED